MSILGQPWPDALTAGIAFITAPLAVYALFQTRAALVEQSVASDMQTVLTLWERLDEHWVRFRKAPEEDIDFEFGQLTGYYELACGLFCDGILATKAARTLQEHLDELLPQLLADQQFKKRFDDLTTSPKTYENIKKYLKRHDASN